MARGRKKGSTEKSIEQLYDENKDVLFEAGYDEATFKAEMKSLMKSNKTRVPGAWKAFKHKTDFTDKDYIGAENLWAGLKDDIKTVRKDVFGWRTKKEDVLKNMKWDKNTKKYIYGTKKLDEDGNEIIYAFELITGPYGSQYWKWSQI